MMIRNNKFIISYLTALASGLAVAVTFFTIKQTNSDITQYIVILALMILMFGYSVIIITIKPSYRKYEDVLAKLHLAIYEIRTLVTSENVSKNDLQNLFLNIVKEVEELFELITNTSCRASIYLVSSEQRLIRFTKQQEKEYLTSRLLDTSPFMSVLEGEKCFIGDISKQELNLKLTNQERFFKSVAVFPISKTEKPQLNIKKRIIIGFLVIDSHESKAFDISMSSKPLSENIYYRTGSAFADLLGILTPMFGKIISSEMDANK